MIAKVRSWFFARKLFRVTRLPAFVVSVGNISMGGTGKSPFVMLLAEKALASGLKVAVLSRGYKRKINEMVLLTSGAETPSAIEIGDEPAMIKRRVPGLSMLVHADRGRRAAHHWAELGAPELVILDDGFQHWKLARQRDVVMIDASEPLFGPTIPLGRLREDASSLGRADLVIVTRAEKLDQKQKELLRSQISAALENRSAPPWKLAESRQPGIAFAQYEFSGLRDLASGGPAGREGEFLLVTGIAKPEGLRQLAQQLGLKVREEMVFPDHHALKAGEITTIKKAVKGAKLLMSEKDAARWAEAFSGIPGSVLEVKFQFDDPAVIERFVTEIAEEARRCSISG